MRGKHQREQTKWRYQNARRKSYKTQSEQESRNWKVTNGEKGDELSNQVKEVGNKIKNVENQVNEVKNKIENVKNQNNKVRKKIENMNKTIEKRVDDLSAKVTSNLIKTC